LGDKLYKLDLVLIEFIRLSYPKVFLLLIKYKSRIIYPIDTGNSIEDIKSNRIKDVKELKEFIDTNEDFIDFEKGNLKKLLSFLFHRLNDVFYENNQAKRDPLSKERKRINEPVNFERYLMYAVPSLQIDESQIKEWITDFFKADNPTEAFDSKYNEFMVHGSQEFMGKVQDSKGVFSNEFNFRIWRKGIFV
jgi:hypothetical protein